MEKVNNFNLVCKTKCMDKFHVEKYKSSETGLTVVIGHVPGPIVKGYFVLATEVYDDDGLPHTLEHVIFLGSEDYPYKGVLDLLANRNLADGTNAWTDTDHTCYTVTTAGSEGFFNLMPVYIDHILYPVLTDAAFVTEVHHVTGDGEDAGVVYCEMQGKENSGETLVHLAMLRAAYPGRCGYKSETGGLMKNLQESTTNAKVRQYHRDFYRPDNMTLIITGQVDTKECLDVLTAVEEKILKKGNLPPFVRPWSEPPPPVTESVEIVLQYACDEEDHGMVYVAWRGPSAVDQIYEMQAISMILRYLSENVASPLQQDFVQTADPLASAIKFNLIENSSTLFYMGFRNVPFAKLNEVKPRLMKKLKELRSAKDVFDMARLSALINKHKLEHLLNMETKPHDFIAFTSIGDMLYGNDVDDMKQRLNPLKLLDKMAEEKIEFWVKLFDDFLINNHCTTVVGKPSVKERERLDQEEKLRIQKQVSALGKEGLKEKQKILDEAAITNNIPPPSSMLTAMPVPDPCRICFHSIQSYTTDSPPPAEKFNIKEFPLYLHLDHIETNFVYLMVLMDTTPVPKNLRMYLPLFLDSIMESPILRDGKLISHLDVVNELEKDTIAAATSIGIAGVGHFSCGPYAQAISLTIQVHPDNYERGIRWLHELLFATRFVSERVSITAAKLVNEVAEFRRKESKLTHDVSSMLNFQKDNNIYCNNAIRQHKFLSEVGKDLCKEKLTPLEDLDKLREIVTNPKNMAVRIATDLDMLSAAVAGDLVDPWKKLIPEYVPLSKQPLAVIEDFKLLREPSDKESLIVGIRTTDSSYLVQTVPCITDYYHPDLAALLVFLTYLEQLEGPMWKQIRGQGLAYGYSLTQETAKGLLGLTLYRATNVNAAHSKAKEIVETHLQPETEFDPVLLVAAISSSVFQVIQREGTMSNVIRERILSYFKGTDINYSREFVKKLAAVTVEDMKRVGQAYVKDLFDSQQVRLSLMCPLVKTKDVGSYLQNAGYTATTSLSLPDVFGCES